MFLAAVFCVREVSAVLGPCFVTPRRFSVVNGESLEFVYHDRAGPTNPLSAPGERKMVRRVPVASFVCVQYPGVSFQLGYETNFVNGDHARGTPVCRVFQSIGEGVSSVFHYMRMVVAVVYLSGHEIKGAMVGGKIKVLLYGKEGAREGGDGGKGWGFLRTRCVGWRGSPCSRSSGYSPGGKGLLVLADCWFVFL